MESQSAVDGMKVVGVCLRSITDLVLVVFMSCGFLFEMCVVFSFSLTNKCPGQCQNCLYNSGKT